MPMRRLSLTLVVVLAVLPAAALASGSATGDGVLELKNVAGNAVIGARGAIWGQLEKGTLVVTDPNPGDNNSALVSGDRDPRDRCWVPERRARRPHASARERFSR